VTKFNVCVLGATLCDTPENEDLPSGYESDGISSCSEEAKEHWDIDIKEVIKDLESDSQAESSMKHGLVHMVLAFLSLWGSSYGISARALDHLIKFLHHIFLSIVPASTTTLAAVFPSSLYMAQKHFGIEVDRFEKYVICKKCGSLYRYKECIETSVGLRQAPKVCSHIEYPNHPFQSQRVPCGQNLLKEIVLQSGQKFYPLKTYCYSPIVDRLSQILTVMIT